MLMYCTSWRTVYIIQSGFTNVLTSAPNSDQLYVIDIPGRSLVLVKRLVKPDLSGKKRWLPWGPESGPINGQGGWSESSGRDGKSAEASALSQSPNGWIIRRLQLKDGLIIDQHLYFPSRIIHGILKTYRWNMENRTPVKKNSQMCSSANNVFVMHGRPNFCHATVLSAAAVFKALQSLFPLPVSVSLSVSCPSRCSILGVKHSVEHHVTHTNTHTHTHTCSISLGVVAYWTPEKTRRKPLTSGQVLCLCVLIDFYSQRLSISQFRPHLFSIWRCCSGIENRLEVKPWVEQLATA